MKHTHALNKHDAHCKFNISNFFAKESNDPTAEAFSAKLGIHPAGKTNMVSADKINSVFQSLIQKKRKGTTAAYIHVPFCENRCLYCCFYKMGYDAEQSEIYTDSLIKELELYKSSPYQSNGPVHAVYLGGGTPTSLQANDLRRLLLAVRANLPLANDCEITIEGRINNFTDKKMDACIEGGVNRFSLGVQTFDTSIRQSMKRISTGKEVIKRLIKLSNFDQAAVAIDLIFGFPGQSMKKWEEDIRIFLELEIEGIDLYQLNIFPGTPLFSALEKGKFPAAPDIKARARMFERGIELMENAKYRRISNEHWGRTSRERNLYNQMMKGPSNCLAFGPGAGGSIENHFYSIESDYKKWIKNVMEYKQKPISMIMEPASNAVLTKLITAEMELSRINTEKLGKAFKLPISRLLDPLYSQWIKTGLMEKKGDWYLLTTAGQFWQVNLAQLTINYLNQTL